MNASLAGVDAAQNMTGVYTNAAREMLYMRLPENHQQVENNSHLVCQALLSGWGTEAEHGGTKHNAYSPLKNNNRFYRFSA